MSSFRVFIVNVYDFSTHPVKTSASFPQPLQGPWMDLKSALDKDRLTGEPHINVFNINFMQHGSLHQKMKTQRDKPELFHAEFDEEWKSATS